MKSKNIQHLWSLLCSGSSIDQKTNNLTLFNIIDRVSIPKNRLITMPAKDGEDKPAAPVIFELVTLWRKLKEDIPAKADVKIEFLDPSGTVRQGADYSIEFAKNINRFRSTMQWSGIRVTTSGLYTFRIFLKEDGEKNFEKVGDVYLDLGLLDEGKTPD